MSISVVLPAYKEAENLKILLPKINQTLLSLKIPFEVLVVDAREKMDDTQEICIHNHCTYIQREGGDFYGDAIRTGIQCAKMDFLVVMDADGSHNPEDIIKLYEAMQSGDSNVIIGSRYTEGGNSCNGAILKLMSYMVNLAYRVIFHIKAKDVSDSFRMYYTEQIQSIDLECENFDIVEEILIRLSIKYPNFALKEVPIYFNKRMSGESKRDLWKFIFSYLSTICRMCKIRKNALNARVKHEDSTAFLERTQVAKKKS